MVIVGSNYSLGSELLATIGRTRLNRFFFFNRKLNECEPAHQKVAPHSGVGIPFEIMLIIIQ